MLDYITGKVAEVTPTYTVLDNNGIGYQINTTLMDYPHIVAAKEHLKLYVFESIREDAHVLYGFMEKASRELFLLLTSVSGVGPNTARFILSTLTNEQLQSAISSGNDHALKAVKGIGGKTAQRIIVDLKDKIKSTGETLITSTPAGENYEDALAALEQLGYAKPQSQKLLSKVFKENPNATAEEAIRQAFKLL